MKLKTIIKLVDTIDNSVPWRIREAVYVTNIYKHIIQLIISPLSKVKSSNENWNTILIVISGIFTIKLK